MQIIDYVCISVCALHFVISLIRAVIDKKRFKTICSKCFQPVFEGDDHKCDPELLQLLDTQKLVLDNYIKQLRGE